MSKPAKWATVLGGYALAWLLAGAAVYLHYQSIPEARMQPSSGMCAFGETILFIAVFGLAALPPTLMAPPGPARRRLLAATLMEGAVAAFALFTWFLRPLLMNLLAVGF